MPMRKREAAFWTIFVGLTAGFFYYRWFQLWRESWPPPRYQVVGAALGTFVAFTHAIYHFFYWDIRQWEWRDSAHRSSSVSPIWSRIIPLAAVLGTISAGLIGAVPHNIKDLVVYFGLSLITGMSFLGIQYFRYLLYWL